MLVAYSTLTSGTVWSIHLKVAAEFALGSDVHSVALTRSIAVITVVALINSSHQWWTNTIEIIGHMCCFYLVVLIF